MFHLEICVKSEQRFFNKSQTDNAAMKIISGPVNVSQTHD